MTEPCDGRAAALPWARTASRAFLVLGTLFGVAFLVVTPPYQAPDEYKHFYRAFQISEGQLAAEHDAGRLGGRLPTSLVASAEELSRTIPFHPDVKQRPEEITRELRRPLDVGNRVFVYFAGLPPPLGYLPQALGIAAARALDWPPVGLVWSGRLANLLIYVALVALAIRCLPVQPWTWTLLALTPMAVFQAASLSPDASINAVSFLFLAFCLRRAAPGSAPLSRRDLGVLAALLGFLGLAKPAYSPLVLATLFLPQARFGGRRRQLLALGALAVATILPALAWIAFMRAQGSNELSPSADPAAQVRFVLLHPLSFAAVLMRTIAEMGPAWLLSFFGLLGWLDVLLSPLVYVLGGASLVAFAVAEGPRAPAGDGRLRSVALATAGACFLAILTLSYVGWNGPGEAIVKGVQGRYFVPLGPLLALALRARRLQLSPAGMGAWPAAIPALLLLESTLCLVRRYWSP